MGATHAGIRQRTAGSSAARATRHHSHLSVLLGITGVGDNSLCSRRPHQSSFPIRSDLKRNVWSAICHSVAVDRCFKEEDNSNGFF